MMANRIRLAAAALALGLIGRARPPPRTLRSRLPEDEIIYFLLPDRFENGDPANDRGGLVGGRLATGFDPAHKGFYHGGDLAGLLKRLDYIQGLGATAIWFAPVFKNKPVQGSPGTESSGYHGYWVTDFTQVDPHFGSNADFKAFVDAAHARGMKVYMDIITNHTADVIYFAECEGRNECAYRSIADYPYQALGGPAGKRINPGFAGQHVGHRAEFRAADQPQLRLHGEGAAGRAQREGAGLAQRPDLSITTAAIRPSAAKAAATAISSGSTM